MTRIEGERRRFGDQAALVACDAAIRACGRSAELLSLRAFLRGILGDHAGAVEDAGAAARIEASPAKLLDLARRQIRVGDYDGARIVLAAALEHPNEHQRQRYRSWVELLLAYATMQVGMIEEGVELARRCSDSGPLWVDGGLITKKWMIEECERVLAEEREADAAAAEESAVDDGGLDEDDRDEGEAGP